MPRLNSQKTIFISSKGLETRTKIYTDAKGLTVRRHFIYGAINGTPFEVLCNTPVAVTCEVAEALNGLLTSQTENTGVL